MRKKRHCPLQGDGARALVAERKCEKGRVDDRQGLNPYPLDVPRLGNGVACRADEGRAKRKHAIAIARCPFSKQHNRIAVSKPPRDFAIDVLCLVPSRPADAYGALKPRQETEAWPGSDLAPR